MRKILLIILAVIMFSATACSEPISESSDGQTAASYQPNSTSEPTISDNTSDSESKSENSFDTSTEITEISSMVTVSDQEPEQSTDKEDNALSIEITVNGHTFSATLYDNETTRAFQELLPLTLDMNELNGNEKYYYLSDSLPTDSSRPSRINAGDIMLYGSECLVIFYESFSTSYSYTPIGKIDNPDELAAALGSGSVQVAFN